MSNSVFCVLCFFYLVSGQIDGAGPTINGPKNKQSVVLTVLCFPGLDQGHGMARKAGEGAAYLSI